MITKYDSLYIYVLCVFSEETLSPGSIFKKTLSLSSNLILWNWTFEWSWLFVIHNVVCDAHPS